MFVTGKRFFGLGGGRNTQQKNHGSPSPFDGYDQHSDDDIPLSLEEKREEMERSSNEYRNIIVMLSEEIESLKSQLATMTQAFEDHIPLTELISLATNSSDTNTGPKVRLIAARTIANLAAREERRPDIVGSLSDLLEVLHRGSKEDENNQRLICAAVANLSIDSKYQGEVVKMGGLSALNHLSDKARDSQTLRMAAGALANLCANALLKDELLGKGVVETLVKLQERVHHRDVEAQVARGLANWVVSTDEFGLGKVLDEFTSSGGLATLLKLGENREAELIVKKQVGTAIYHTFKSFPQMTKEQIVHSSNGIKPLLEMKKCADKEVSELAESCLKLYHDTTLM